MNTKLTGFLLFVGLAALFQIYLWNSTHSSSESLTSFKEQQLSEQLNQAKKRILELEAKLTKESNNHQKTLAPVKPAPKNQPPTPLQSVSTTALLQPFYRKEQQFYHFCMDNCGLQGLGSHMITKSFYYNLSLELGFKLYLMNHVKDYVQEEHKDLYFQPVFPQAHYNPPKCDFVYGGYEAYKLACIRERHFVSNFFDSYHTWIHSFLAHFYSVKLRGLAKEIVGVFRTRFPLATFIGFHSRLDFQYKPGRQDIRSRRNLTDSEISTMLFAFQTKAGPNFQFLTMGDTSVVNYANVKHHLLMEFEIRKMHPYLTKLQVLFVSLDVLSQLCQLRLLIQYGSNWPLHLAFHRLNNNIEKLIIGDAFTMRTYDYYRTELEQIGVFDVQKYFRHEAYNPYTYQPNDMSQKFAVNCLREKLFGETPFNQTLIEGGKHSCTKKFEEGEVGHSMFYQTEFY